MTDGNENVGVAVMVEVGVMVGVNVIVGVNVAVGVKVSVGVNVGVGVSVHAAAVAVREVAVSVACSSGEAPQAERKNATVNRNEIVFI